MQHPKPRFTMSLFALVLLTANAARADMIDFSVQASFAPTSIAPDQPTLGARIYFESTGVATFTGDPSLVQHAVGVANQSPPWLSTPTTYTNKPFVISLKLTDGPSGLSDTLAFHGLVNGGILSNPPPMWAGEAAGFSFSDGVRTVGIGQDLYHIAMQSGAIFGGTDPIPNIIAQIDVTHGSNTPEPSSLLLAAIALPWLGFARWKKLAARTKKS